MREIKFRAYHPEWDEMIYSSNSIMFKKREFYPFGFQVGFSHYPKDDGWIIMQHTGLEDVNGNPIYEGDLLGSDGEDGALEVVWHDSGFAIKREVTSKFKAHTGYAPLTREEASKLIVVGNIHQNHELAQEKVQP